LINFVYLEVFMWGSFAVVWVLIVILSGVNLGVLQIVLLLLIVFAVAMVMSGVVVLVVEWVVYWWLIWLNLLLLIALISVIGMLFVFGEIMGLWDKIVGWVGLDYVFVFYIKGVWDNISFLNLFDFKIVFNIGSWVVSNIDIIVLVVVLVMMVGLD